METWIPVDGEIAVGAAAVRERQVQRASLEAVRFLAGGKPPRRLTSAP